MKISFVIPAYNEECLLPLCLQSIERELARTPCEAEVIVVDNASTDQTGAIARRHSSVRVVEEPVKGLVQARKSGFIASSGELVANIDADTELTPGWIETVLKEFERDPLLVALSGPYKYRDLSPFVSFWVTIFYFFGWLGHLFNQHVLGTGAMIQGGNFVLRRDAWEKAGGFDPSIKFYGEDTDVAKRIGRYGRVKWTWHLPMHTSGRRLAKEGVLRTGYVYAINFFSVTFWGRPVTNEYSDIRL